MTRSWSFVLPCGWQQLPPGEGPEDEYRRLCNELMRLMLAGQLFTFVTAVPVAEAERRNDGSLGNEQRVRADAPLPGAGPGYGPYQQDAGWRTASNGDRERVGIATSVSFCFYAIERDPGNRALAASRPKLLRPAGSETRLDRRPIASRQPIPAGSGASPAGWIRSLGKSTHLHRLSESRTFPMFTEHLEHLSRLRSQSQTFFASGLGVGHCSARSLH